MWRTKTSSDDMTVASVAVSERTCRWAGCVNSPTDPTARSARREADPRWASSPILPDLILGRDQDAQWHSMPVLPQKVVVHHRRPIRPRCAHPRIDALQGQVLLRGRGHRPHRPQHGGEGLAVYVRQPYVPRTRDCSRRRRGQSHSGGGSDFGSDPKRARLEPIVQTEDRSAAWSCVNCPGDEVRLRLRPCRVRPQSVRRPRL
jgi:hypothetical protein